MYINLRYLSKVTIFKKVKSMISLRIWSSRIFSFLPIYLFGTFTVCIPWKISQLEMGETTFSYIILTFGIAMIIVTQFCRIVLMPKFGTLHLMPIGGLLFSINFYYWTTATEYWIFLLLAFPAGIFLDWYLLQLMSRPLGWKKKQEKFYFQFLKHSCH